MKKAAVILFLAAFMVALPFLFKPKTEKAEWNISDPVLVAISPHNEAIRQEFATAFSKWHNEKFGQPVRIDWRSIGGTTEIMRFLCSEYIGSMEGWCLRNGMDFPSTAASAMLDGREVDASRENAALLSAIRAAYRTNDSPEIASSRIDILFGGGSYDHGKAAEQGLTVKPWEADEIPVGIIADENGAELIPKELSGDTWRTDYFYGAVLSTFGICWNKDRLVDCGIGEPPMTWRDLASPKFFGQVGVADPTKSGSVSKAYEMIVQQQMAEYIDKLGYTDSDITAFAKKGFSPRWKPSDDKDAKYLDDVSKAWVHGMNLVRLIGANSKYFTDAAGKIPVDVGMGAIAAGVAIDFYGRFQAEYTRTVDGNVHMEYATPKGGSCVSADPISLLRGAPHRELALRFIEFVLSEDGQALWNSRPGTPAGTVKYALRRLPIRRDFYPSDNKDFQEVYERHISSSSDDLSSDDINPYRLAENFTYRPEWSARHFGIQRDLVRAMCLDSGHELRMAWKAVIDNGGPEANPEAMELIGRMPTKPIPVTWQSAVTDYRGVKRLEYMSIWTAEMRANYREAARLANEKRR